MEMMAKIIKHKQLEIKAYQAKYRRKLTDDEIFTFENRRNTSSVLDTIDQKLLI